MPEGDAKDLLEASAADTVEVGPFQVQPDPGNITAIPWMRYHHRVAGCCHEPLAAPDGACNFGCLTKSAPSLQGAGLNLRGNIIGAFRYRTVLIMCEGLAIATAKALIEAESSVGGLNFPLRENVVLYYRVSIGLVTCHAAAALVTSARKPPDDASWCTAHGCMEAA